MFNWAQGALMAAWAFVLSLSARAAGSADTNITGLIDNGKATFDYVLPVVVVIAGLFIAWKVGKALWNRFSH